MARLHDKLMNRVIQGKLTLDGNDDVSSLALGTKLYKHEVEIEDTDSNLHDIIVISLSSEPVDSANKLWVLLASALVIYDNENYSYWVSSGYGGLASFDIADGTFIVDALIEIGGVGQGGDVVTEL